MSGGGSMAFDVGGDVEVMLERGLSTQPARRISRHAQDFACTVTLRSARGAVADARNMVELLLLGVGRGERVAIRYIGADARIAFDTLAELLGER